MDVYRSVAWLGWVVNFMVAEFIIRRPGIFKAKKISLRETQ
jgi:hypothetical protein